MDQYRPYGIWCRHVTHPSGHIEQLPSGSWRAKVYAGKDPLTGREIQFRKTCKSELAAQIELGKPTPALPTSAWTGTTASRRYAANITVRVSRLVLRQLRCVGGAPAGEVTVSDETRAAGRADAVIWGGRDALPALWKKTTMSRPRGPA